MSVTSRIDGSGGKNPFLLGDVLLEDVGLDRAAELCRRGALLLADAGVERKQHRRRALIVIEVETSASGCPGNSVSTSASESIATLRDRPRRASVGVGS